MATGCTAPTYDIEKRGTKLEGSRLNVEKGKQHTIPAADF